MSGALWTSAEAAAATNGRTNAPWQASGVSIDTRNLKPGDLFVAIAGPNRDGHDFVAEAQRRGAAAALVSRSPAALPADFPLLMVDDTQTGMENLARFARARADARVIGVTGSVGKTTTKEAIGLGLATAGPTHTSEGNLNNRWGVPLSLARLPKDAHYAVFEMGMNHAGEIAPLARLVSPHLAVITAVEPVHMEFFANVADIADAKAEIFIGMTGGTAILNRDNPFFATLFEKAIAQEIGRIVGFGAHPQADARLLAWKPERNGATIEAVIGRRHLTYRLASPGRHIALNSLAALAAVDAVGANTVAASAALAGMMPVAGRGRVERIALGDGELTLIDESYNASLPSMRAAIAVLAESAPGMGGRRIAVLGDMLELGAQSAAHHAALAGPLVAAGIDLVYTVGPQMRRLADALPGAMREAHFDDAEEAARDIAGAIRPGDVVTIKGSYGMRMRVLVEAIRALGGPRSAAGNG